MVVVTLSDYHLILSGVTSCGCNTLRQATKADHTQGNFCRRRHGNIIVRACCAWKHCMVHSTSRLEIDGLSILKQLVECSIRYFMRSTHKQ